ncbi:MAG TPA: sigma-70 family RNA polymerase sigma factor [Micromonosporaceae bacterium]|nr:sigma-70 family RNA polymerase sigma factor [Micromonosporaceae bacterium]
MESAKLVARLARMVGDVGAAEEIAQDVLVIALEQWPADGVPDSPAAWLMATGKHRAVDLVRRRVTYQRKLERVGRDLETASDPDLDDDLDDHLRDDMLRLVFTACHPSLSTDASVALVLRVLAGMRTDEIARALLVTEATVAQRIVRAKRTLAGVAFELPTPRETAERLAAVLEIVYLIFNEGYAATAGSDWVRPALCNEAMRLGRVLAGLAPWEPEVHALVALMELQASRIPARTGPDGAPILLPDQDRRRWDRLLIRHGLAAIDRVTELGGTYRPYALQAAIAACHARAVTAADTDWVRIAALYGILATLSPSPVVELNRAVAIGFADGPEHGLAIVDQLVEAGVLPAYPQLPAVRGDLLARLGRRDEARAEFHRAASLTRNDRERDIFAHRARDLDGGGAGHAG